MRFEEAVAKVAIYSIVAAMAILCVAAFAGALKLLLSCFGI